VGWGEAKGRPVLKTKPTSLASSKRIHFGPEVGEENPAESPCACANMRGKDCTGMRMEWNGDGDELSSSTCTATKTGW